MLGSSRLLRNLQISRNIAGSSTMPLRAKIMSPLIRNLSTASPAVEEDDVKFSSNKALRTVLLNRPSKLNSLNQSMVDKMTPRLREWAKSDLAKTIILKGAGEKALCAGGDVAALVGFIKNDGEKGPREAADFFLEEYQLNHLVATYPKPYVALQDGITMGGGVGISVHAPFRVATERTLFAMPETTIGLFPDVGGTFFLPRLDGQLGMYLALTSGRLKGFDNVIAGIATHYVPSSRLPDLEERIAELTNPVAQGDASIYDLVNSAIEEFVEDAPEGYSYPFGGETRKLIDSAFSADSVEEALSILEANGSEFALKTKATILERSPTSVKVTFQALRRGKHLDISNALKAEYHLAEQFMKHPDFVEGVSARLFSKPPRTPSWDPATLADITPAFLTEYLARHPDYADYPDIEFFVDTSYAEYPHKYGFPTEKEIGDYITGTDSTRDFKVSRKEVIEAFNEKTGSKVGIIHKIDDVLARKTVPDSTDSTLLDWVY